MNSEPKDTSNHVLESGRDKPVLKVHGFHIPSFKNSKVLFVTNPRNRELMKRIQAAFEGQLLSSCPMSANETEMAQKLRSWIVMSGPENDSCRYLTQCSWRFIAMPKGMEGAELTFDPIYG